MFGFFPLDVYDLSGFDPEKWAKTTPQLFEENRATRKSNKSCEKSQLSSTRSLLIFAGPLLHTFHCPPPASTAPSRDSLDSKTDSKHGRESSLVVEISRNSIGFWSGGKRVVEKCRWRDSNPQARKGNCF